MGMAGCDLHRMQMTQFSHRSRSVLIELICFALILLFVYAALNKWMDYKSFEVQMGQSPLLLPFAHWLVIAVPAVEIGISFLLAFPSTRMTGLYASFTLMNMFTLHHCADEL